MGSLATIGLAYVALCGTVAAGCVAGRGLVRAAESASRGDLSKAGEEVLAAAAAPALLAFDAASALVNDVAAKARELGRPALERPGPPAP